MNCEGKVLLKKRVSGKKLIRLLWEYRPRILAVDNITELGTDKRELVKILNLMPPEMEVVQVTRISGEYVDLRKLAEEAEINLPPGKLGPEDTSYVLAVLALKGIGTKLKVFEEKTKIIVTKGRTPRAGGSSLNRFKRATKNAVMETVREIKEVLEKEGIDYDLVLKKSDGSIESASFTVYAPRKRLEGLVKPINTSAVRVRIKPVITRHISFEEEEYEKKYLIVGIDPGIETGIAILDLDGNVIHLSSAKNIDRGDIIALISKYGIPIMIATDTNPPTHAAKKLAAVLKTELYYPKSSLSIKEKETIAQEYTKKGVKVEDSHQRDALAAAHKALMSIKDKLAKVDSYLDKFGLDIDKDRIKVEVLRGRSVAELIEEELEKLIEESTEEARATEERTQKRESRKGIEDVIKLAYLEAENVNLKMKIKELNEQIERLKLELKILHDEIAEEVERRAFSLKEALRQVSERLREKEEEVKRLEERLKEAGADLIRVDRGDAFPALYVPRMSYASSIDLSDLKDFKIKAIYVNTIEDLNPEFLDEAYEKKIIIAAKDVSEAAKRRAEEVGVPIITLDANVYGDVAVLPTEVIEKWEEERRKLRRRKPLGIEDLERLIEEYRASRWL